MLREPQIPWRKGEEGRIWAGNNEYSGIHEKCHFLE